MLKFDRDKVTTDAEAIALTRDGIAGPPENAETPVKLFF
jgi:hypothetical protein